MFSNVSFSPHSASLIFTVFTKVHKNWKWNASLLNTPIEAQSAPYSELSCVCLWVIAFPASSHWRSVLVYFCFTAPDRIYHLGSAVCTPFSSRPNFCTWHFEMHFVWAGPASGAVFQSSALSEPCTPLPVAMLLAWFTNAAFTSRVLMKTLNSNELLESHCDFKRRVLTKKADLVKLWALINRWSPRNGSITCTPVPWLPYYLQSLQLCPGTAVGLACEEVPCQFVTSAGLKCSSPVGAAFSRL